MDDLDATDRELLVQEYMQLQKIIDDFNSRALTVKAWSVTFSAAAIGAAFVEERPALLLVATGSALVFWLTETVWKTHQLAFFPRIEAIEDYFSYGGQGLRPLRIRRDWWENLRGRHRGIRWLKAMFYFNIMMPHVAVAAAGSFLFLFWPVG